MNWKGEDAGTLMNGLERGGRIMRASHICFVPLGYLGR